MPPTTLDRRTTHLTVCLLTPPPPPLPDGFQTLRRGDVLEYVSCGDDEDASAYRAAVLGVLVLQAEGKEQGRKFVILYELKTKVSTPCPPHLRDLPCPHPPPQP